MVTDLQSKGGAARTSTMKRTTTAGRLLSNDVRKVRRHAPALLRSSPATAEHQQETPEKLDLRSCVRE